MSKKKGAGQGGATQKKIEQALAFHQSDQFPAAEKVYREILASQPRHPEVLLLLAQLLVSTEQTEKALPILQRNALINASHPVARFNLGMVFLKLARFEEALKEFQQAVILFPNYPEAWSNRGIALQKLDRHAEAIEIFNQGLRYGPNDPALQINLGVSLQKTGRHLEALTTFDAAAQNDPDNPALACNRLLSLGALHRHEEALVTAEKALQFSPHDADAHDNHGQVLQALGRHQEALQSFNKAIKHAPDKPSVHLHAGLCKLLLGNFEKGWEGYVWRWQMPQFLLQQRFKPEQLWHGKASLHDKTIFVYAEQGFGDTLQFCRYIPLLAAQGARVIFEAQAPLQSLLSQLVGVTELISKDDPIPEFDFHCPLLNLPMAMGTTIDCIPTTSPYLQADTKTREYWKARLENKGKKRIGLVWAGNQGFTNDANRSLPLIICLPMLSDDWQWIGLQHDLREGDADLLQAIPQFLNMGPEFRDFSDAAAAIAELDLVITVDTAMAHLAGALNKPVWLLLPFNPDWRWLLARTDSPWYPTFRLFRQPQPNDWNSVITALREALQTSFPE